MLNKFRQKFGISVVDYRTKLEDAIIEKFGSIQYTKFEAYNDKPITYTCGTKFEWESNDIETQEEYHTPIESLAGLFIEQTRDIKDDESVEWYYDTIYRDDFEEIIRSVKSNDGLSTINV